MRTAGQGQVRRRVTSSNGRSVSATMPSATSRAAERFLEHVAPDRAARRGAAVRTVTSAAIAARLVEAHDEVAGAVVGALHRAELHAG